MNQREIPSCESLTNHHFTTTMHRYLAKLAEREDEMLDVKIITFMTDATDCDMVTRAEKLVRDFLKARQGIQLADFAVSSATVPGSSGMTRIANTLIIFYKHVPKA